MAARWSRRLSRASHPVLEAGGYLSPRGAIHLARDGEEIDLVDGVTAAPIGRRELEQRLPGLRPNGPTAPTSHRLPTSTSPQLHADFLAAARRAGTEVRTDSRFASARREAGGWR